MAPVLPRRREKRAFAHVPRLDSSAIRSSYVLRSFSFLHSRPKRAFNASPDILRLFSLQVRAIQYTPDHVVSASYDRTLKIWSRKDRRVVKEFRGQR